MIIGTPTLCVLIFYQH